MKQELTVTLQTKGRITIPDPYRKSGGLKPGDILKLTIEKLNVSKQEVKS